MNRRGELSVSEPGQATTALHQQASFADSTLGGARRSSQNRLLHAAQPLLNFMVQIRTGQQAIDPAMLRDRLISAIRQFQHQAQIASMPVEAIIGARYCLCTALDESVALTSWGGEGVWSAHSLLVIFHNETWGGEKFFQLLARLIQDPQRHWPLIELQYQCLALGFEGRYRIIANGHAQLEGLKLRLRKLLGHGEQEALASNWLDPQARASPPLRHWIPLWAWLLIAGIFSGAVYVVLLLMLNTRLDQAYTTVNAIHLPELDILAAPAQGELHLAQLLDADIRHGALSVIDAADHHVITMHGDGLFDSGRDAIKPAYKSVLEHIAAALDRLPGRIVLSGYTDNQPIHNAHFADNLALSRARAQAVADFLHHTALGAHRMIEVRGLGEDQPIASNASPAGRALNRRVEMALYPDRGEPTP